ncbi:tRNA splicing endonuclease subunit sen2 [Naganishia albida]|nr:tRNA splicing endonuclease subunit sen2 [Naganishia albida]
MSAPRGGASSRGNRGCGGKSSYARTRTNNLKYGTPLPILLPASPLHPAYEEPPVPEFILARRRAQAAERGEPGPVEGEPAATVSLANVIRLFSKLSHSPSTDPVMPRCKGIFDPLTRSVFVTSPEDRDILFDRGFFGKGNLSRSEASWKTRRLKHLQEIAGQAAAAGKELGGPGGRKMTAEEVTAERRRERKQFKIDRAQAILNASLAAEAILRSSSTTTTSETPDALRRVDSTTSNTTAATSNLAQQADVSIPNVSDYAHVLPEGVTRLTPQTFLQRPTRPDSKPKTRSKPPTPVAAGTETPSEQAMGQEPAVQELPKALVDPVSVEDMEHLQLNMEEALFLCWGVGCLDVIDPKTQQLMSPLALFQRILSLQQPLKIPSSSSYMSQLPLRRPDNPFLISYIAYHHYRSLGWVVKTGIKFCVDWLLYKKGMVFSHAEFALLVIPNHQDPENAQACPFALNNEQPMSWQWLNTVNRVNTQVKKTLILCYVTIPPIASITEDDWANPERLLSRYSVREVTIRRFVPARMRD